MKEVKRTQRMEKIFANPLPDKGLVCRMYKELLHLKLKRTLINLKLRMSAKKSLLKKKKLRKRL